MRVRPLPVKGAGADAVVVEAGEELAGRGASVGLPGSEGGDAIGLRVLVKRPRFDAAPV